jgi:hypothetical protein
MFTRVFFYAYVNNYLYFFIEKCGRNFYLFIRWFYSDLFLEWGIFENFKVLTICQLFKWLPLKLCNFSNKSQYFNKFSLISVYSHFLCNSLLIRKFLTLFSHFSHFLLFVFLTYSHCILTLLSIFFLSVLTSFSPEHILLFLLKLFSLNSHFFISYYFQYFYTVLTFISLQTKEI